LVTGRRLSPNHQFRSLSSHLLKLATLLAGRKEIYSFANLSNTQDAREKHTRIDGFHPAFHLRVWGNSAPAEFGKHVGIEQESGHSSIGRP
jgi:hypothetical protein